MKQYFYKSNIKTDQCQSLSDLFVAKQQNQELYKVQMIDQIVTVYFINRVRRFSQIFCSQITKIFLI
ncbi:MAG: hypothetical protein LBC20_07945, partial [Planctomycetaceae bacterium]|nr:hypothetical protein [Planctomycetaceae bacterium]